MHKLKPFEEKAVIYHSSEDGCWVAHGLRTDQIGMGNSLVDALADFLKAIDQVLELAGQDQSVAYLREAPDEIQKLAQSARKLPKEIYEIAHRKVHGQWPEDLETQVNPRDEADVFTAEVPEVVAC